MSRKKFFVFVITSKEEAKSLFPIYKEIIARQEELGCDAVAIVDTESDAKEFSFDEQVLFDTAVVSREMIQSGILETTYRLKFEGWKPSMVFFTGEMRGYLKELIAKLANEIGISVFELDYDIENDTIEDFLAFFC